ncbi:pentapeptide repeat-containing protein, partial [Streptomyces sp. NPDC002215]|uniref:pentapeptide repeat-containing protein n=1 Tax=Streptomyces sp. NPDC002215 TaxID=3154412 RepID=UPI003331D74C
MSTLRPPSWPYCAHGADPATDPIGCRGVHVPSYTACLAHLAETDRDTYLSGLAPGANIDHRDTHFTEDLLDRLLGALREPTYRNLHLGDARFEGAQFSGDAMFRRAQFSGDARFDKAQFSSHAMFDGSQFSGAARFDKAQFSSHAMFDGSQFSGAARFDKAQFSS